MPNWCEGNIRLRGSAEAIKEFLKNELAVTGYANGLAGAVSQRTTTMKSKYADRQRRTDGRGGPSI